MVSKSSERKIELPVVQNARELGGLETADGRRIRKRTLLRSANLIEATSEDFRRLTEDQGLNLVIDLRTAEEIWRKPDKRSDDVEYCPYPVVTDRLLGLTHEEDPVSLESESGSRLKPKQKQKNSQIPEMEKIYRLIAINEECRDRLRGIVTMIAEHDYSGGSVLWHCSEGKDRCGIVTALILIMLGVSREDIMEDYLLTNDVNGPKAEQIYSYIMADQNDSELAEAVKRAYLADRTYMEAAFSAMKEKSGSLYAYVTDWIGISEDLIEEFRSKVLE